MTVASYFPFSLNLTKLLRVVKSVFVTCDSNIRSEGKYFPHIFFNLLSKNVILTALRVDPDWRQTGIAANAALPAVTLNFLSKESCALSDNTVVLYNAT
jgi:hypothetical protein